MRFRFLSALLISIVMLLAACSPEHSKIIVAEYGDDVITLGEFEKAYAKNAGGYEEAEKDSIDEYKSFLDLYSNFRMKLKDADLRQYDKNPDLKKELDDYRDKVGVAYIKEKMITEPGLKKLYERRTEEIRVSHILIRSERRKKEDALTMATNVLDSIKNGKSFEDMASRYSEDQFSKVKGGDIYFITGGQIIPAFEDAAFSLQAGEIYPEPVETRYGYHIIKVTDRRARVPEVKASHMLFKFKGEDGKVDTAAALAKAEVAMDSIKNGADFAEYAKAHSEDKGSAVKGGDLGFFGRRRMVPPFDEAAFNLKVGEVSDLVESRFGYHIIKLTDQKELPTYEEDKKTLKKNYEKNYFKDQYAEFVDSLKAEYDFEVMDDNVQLIYAKADSVVNKEYETISNWSEVKDSVVMTYNDKKVSADGLMSFIAGTDKFKNRFVDSSLVYAGVDEFANEKLVVEKVAQLGEIMPEFADLMDDYKNGIYIFKLQEEEVWDKIKIDSVELKKFWEETKDNYVSADRVEFKGIYANKDSAIKAIRQEALTSGVDFDTLAQEKSERAIYGGNKSYFGTKEVAKDDLAKAAFELDKPGDISEPVKFRNGWYILKLVKKMPSKVKSYEDAKAEAASAYQEKQSKELEAGYLEKLKKLYEPELYYDKLENAYKPVSEE